MRKFIWTIGLLLLSHATNAASIPDWYTTPPNDSIESFHSVGAGHTLEEAKTDALVTLSARLIVNISSEQESQVEKQNESVDMRLISNTVQTTEELSFFKVDVLRQVQGEQQTFVLVSASKQQVFDSIRDKLNTTIAPLLEVNKTTPSDTMSQALQFYSLWPTYSKYYRVLQSYQQPTQVLAAKLATFETTAKAIQSGTGFQIVAGSDNKFKLAQVVEQQLKQLGFTASEKRHYLQVAIIGPELQNGQSPRDLAYKATGKIVYALDGDVIFEPLFPRLLLAVITHKFGSNFQTMSEAKFYLAVTKPNAL